MTDSTSSRTSRSHRSEGSSVFWCTALPLLIVYHLTGARTVTGEDSGELVTAAWQWGVAHPPGTPLWVMTVGVFQRIFGGLSPAGSAALASGVFTAMTMGFMAKIMTSLGVRGVIAVLASWTVGLGTEIWNHATIAEVYPLNLCLLAASIFMFLRWREKPIQKRLTWMALTYGCGLATHPTFFLFLPVLVPALLLSHPRVVLSIKSLGLGLLCLALPHVLYLQVAIAAANDPYVSWGVEPTFSSVFAHAMRQAYESGPEKTQITLTKLLAQAQVFGQYLTLEFTLVGLVVATSGLWLLYRRDRFAGGLFAALVLLGSFGMLAFLKFDLEREEMVAARVFLMPAYLFLGVGLAFAGQGIWERLGDRRRGASLAFLSLVPFLVGAFRWSDHDRTQYFWAEDYGRAILNPLPKDAVLLPGGDTSTFPLLYLQGVLQLRSDVLILDRSGVIERHEALALLPEHVAQKYADAPEADLRMAVLLQSTRPVVVMRRESLPTRSGRTLVPLGLGFVVMPPLSAEDHDVMLRRQGEFLDKLVFRNDTSRTVKDHTSDVIRGHVAQVRAAYAFERKNQETALAQLQVATDLSQGIKESLNNIGALLAENCHHEKALRLFEQALAIRGDYHLGRRNYVLTLRSLGRAKDALTEAARGLAIDPKDDLLFEEAAKAALQIPDGPALHRICDRRESVDPADARPHRFRGIYALHHEGAVLLAKAHFEQALRLDPEDSESQEAVRDIDARLQMVVATKTPGADNPDAALTLSRLLASDYLFDSGRRGPEGASSRKAGTTAPAVFHIPGGGDVHRLQQGARPQSIAPQLRTPDPRILPRSLNH